MNKQIEEIVGKTQKVNRLDEQGCTSEVSQIITDKGCYLLKSSFEGKYREWLMNEGQVLEKLNHNNQIPVPKYYGFIEERDSSHLIMSFEDGITLTSALNNTMDITEKNSLIRSFGHLLNCLHETQTIESLNHKNDWLTEQLRKAEFYVKSDQTEGSWKQLQKLMLNKPLPVQQVMIHGDCTTDNVLVVNGEVRLFIDVAGMTIGDPRYDESLAIRSFMGNEVYINAFYEGYKRYKVSKEEFQYFDKGLYEFF
ncbi:aminoglycoside phosphotransferase family protein [Evansella tamaricis]|uniref:Aminoglycoside phosphotransferase family protein n=1 Tax=Evansella tamaricis TaxID=2069301 RepID=A0ABS6JE09_9BACI|nr:aminoglycoside phosphotransferase family protein [Evansella tamaricis]